MISDRRKLPLSHYTSRAGLEGIARTGALWATNFMTVNDSSEYLYAWKQIQAAAFRYAIDKLPADILKPGANPSFAAASVLSQFQELLSTSDGYGHLYITSFAIAQTNDMAERGSLTLWDRYTGFEGYCLQFDAAHLRHRLELDATKSTYGWVELADVIYGVDTKSPSFRELAMQFGEHLVLHLAQQTGDRRIQPRHDIRWAPEMLATGLQRFCGIHKDPAFIEEHEARILAYPLAYADARVLFGLSHPKQIQVGPAGKKHIVIGDRWRPGLSPSRIIIGPHADPNIGDIVRLFHEPPVVEQCDIPVRRRPG